MTPAPHSQRARILLLGTDPVLTQLLKSLLQALPAPAPEVVHGHDTADDTASLARTCDHCLVDCDATPLPLDRFVAQLKHAAPRLRIHAILRGTRAQGDRLALVRALRAGLSTILEFEELSPGMLAQLLHPGDEAHAAARPAVLALANGPEAGFTTPAGDHDRVAARGSWRIRLDEQRAAFDPDALRDLGYAPGEVHEGIGDWKALIHPDDIDRVVQELQHVLDGTATPYAVSYRLRARDGTWVPVVSEDITLGLGAKGEPQSITGRFYREGAAEATPTTPASIPPPATASAGADIARELLALCDTAFVLYRRDSGDVFRVQWCNAAAERLEQRDAAALAGLRARESAPAFDGFEIEDALARVLDTGIGEVHEVMSLARGDSAHWRRLHFNRHDDDGVLAEMEDISEQVGARTARRIQDELAQHIVRSYPLASLLLDEQGRIVQCMTPDTTLFGDDRDAVENGSLTGLFGSTAGAQCLQQAQRTLNTGHVGSGTYAIDTSTGRRWLECSTALLRGRPGMPQRVILVAQDISQRVKDGDDARQAAAQFREGLRDVPLPLYLKDIEGRYQVANAAFETLFGVESSMLLGKTDFEIFPDELAAEMHEADRPPVEHGETRATLRTVGQGAERASRYCFQFPWRDAAGAIIGCGGLWFAPADLPRSTTAGATTAAAPEPAPATSAASDEGIEAATASVISRVEAALTGTADYADLARQLEQLVDTSTQARALIARAAEQAQDAPPAALVALAPLAQGILDLERLLLPPSAKLVNEIEQGLPLAQCDPVAFHQIMLRAVRHARRTLGPRGTLHVALKRAVAGRRACLSCREGFEGEYVELVVEDSDSMISAADLDKLSGNASGAEPAAEAMQDLAEIHALCHAQGGHLQIQRAFPAGTSVHVFLRAAEGDSEGRDGERARSTIAHFPRERTSHH